MFSIGREPGRHYSISYRVYLFLTLKMRQDGGTAHMVTAIEKMSHKQREHYLLILGFFPVLNSRRLTGRHETANKRGAFRLHFRISIPCSFSLRGKTRTLDGPITSIEQVPGWTYAENRPYNEPNRRNMNSSGIDQQEGMNSDEYLRPVAIFRDPFRRGDNILVMCECYTFDDKPHPSNKRSECLSVMEKVAAEHPCVGTGGPKMGSLDLRALTTVQWALRMFMDGRW
eukprot:sb/3469523/